jgi:hypothetical protein
MPHTKGECRYCGKVMDARGLGPHERTHPQFKPRTKEERINRAKDTGMTGMTKGARLQAVRERVRASAASRAMQTQYPVATPPPPPLPESPMAPPEVQAILSGRVRVPKEIINEAYETFTNDPLMFSAYCYFFAPTEDDIGKILNLKTCMQFLDLKIQALGGWNGEDLDK